MAPVTVLIYTSQGKMVLKCSVVLFFFFFFPAQGEKVFLSYV